jgi:hypothetical protein
MARPPRPSKTQQAVATNKAAQQQRAQRVAETAQKIQQIQAPKTPKAPKAPKAPPVLPPVDPFSTPEYLALLQRFEAQAAANSFAAEQAAATARQNRIDAFEVLKTELTNLGLPEFVPIIQGYITQDISPSVAPTLLEQTDVYKQRFIGNEARRQKGLQQLDMAGYLNAERDYRQLLKQYNLSALDNKETYAALIGGDVSLDEATDRITDVFNKIDNADATLKQSIGQYFNQYGVTDPTIQKQQVALAILSGDQGAKALQKTLQKAQLRAGAQFAGISVGEAAIEELQRQASASGVADVYGLAKQGFSTLAQTQAETERLTQIYGAQPTTVAETAIPAQVAPKTDEELKQEAFFGLASQRRKKLQEKERAAFSGATGTSTVSLTQKSTAGQL